MNKDVTAEITFGECYVYWPDGLEMILNSGLEFLAADDKFIITGKHDAVRDLCNNLLETANSPLRCEKLVGTFYLTL